MSRGLREGSIAQQVSPQLTCCLWKKAKADETALMPLALQGWCFVSPKGKSPAQHYGSLSLISSQIQELYCHSGHVCLGHTFRKATEKKVKIMCYINVEGAVCSPGNPTSSTGPRCKWGGHRENHKEAQLLVIKHEDSKFTLFSLGNS